MADQIQTLVFAPGSDCADCGERRPIWHQLRQWTRCESPDVCVNALCCFPDCEGRQCGDDGCGGICGDCGLGNAEYRLTIAGGTQLEQSRTEQISLLLDNREWKEVGRVDVGPCVPSCKPGQRCGSDGCGGECGAGCGADEACAQGICVGSGDVRVTVSWETDADLDVYVRAPNGELIYWSAPRGGDGGLLDVDAHAGCAQGQAEQPGIENIFWAEDTAPEGLYIVSVEQWSSCNVNVTPYTVTVLRNGRQEVFEGVFDMSPARERREVTRFELDDARCIPDCGPPDNPYVCGSDGCGGTCGNGCADDQQCLSGICAGLGDLSISLQWDTEHDLDLRVVAPNGDTIDFGNDGPFGVVGGGQLDVDSHAACRDSRDAQGNPTPGVENIFWPQGGAPDGEYIIYVSNWSDCEYRPEQLMCSEAFICQ